MMKNAIKIAARASAVLLVITVICVAIGPVSNNKLRQFDDVTPNELAALEHKAIHEGDQVAAAELYWYYRLNRQDYVTAKKWEYAVRRSGETNDITPTQL